MSGRPVPAVGSFPYPHRTVEQVDAEIERRRSFAALREAEAERVGQIHARVLARNVVPPSERLR